MLRKLLLVDHDDDECHLFDEILQTIDKGIACYYASNGKDAVQKLEAKDIQVPDVCFVGINMHMTNGWELIEYLQFNHSMPSLRIVVYSPSSREADLQRATDMGVSYFIKPTTTEELKVKLEAFYQGIIK